MIACLNNGEITYITRLEDFMDLVPDGVYDALRDAVNNGMFYDYDYSSMENEILSLRQDLADMNNHNNRLQEDKRKLQETVKQLKEELKQEKRKPDNNSEEIEEEYLPF